MQIPPGPTEHIFATASHAFQCPDVLCVSEACHFAILWGLSVCEQKLHIKLKIWGRFELLTDLEWYIDQLLQSDVICCGRNLLKPHIFLIPDGFSLSVDTDNVKFIIIFFNSPIKYPGRVMCLLLLELFLAFCSCIESLHPWRTSARLFLSCSHGLISSRKTCGLTVWELSSLAWIFPQNSPFLIIFGVLSFLVESMYDVEANGIINYTSFFFQIDFDFRWKIMSWIPNFVV